MGYMVTVQEHTKQQFDVQMGELRVMTEELMLNQHQITQDHQKLKAEVASLKERQQSHFQSLEKANGGDKYKSSASSE